MIENKKALGKGLIIKVFNALYYIKSVKHLPSNKLNKKCLGFTLNRGFKHA